MTTSRWYFSRRGAYRRNLKARFRVSNARDHATGGRCHQPAHKGLNQTQLYQPILMRSRNRFGYESSRD